MLPKHACPDSATSAEFCTEKLPPSARLARRAPSKVETRTEERINIKERSHRLRDWCFGDLRQSPWARFDEKCSR